MYAFFDGICFLLALGQIALTFILKYKWYWAILGLVWLCAYPILNECVYNAWAHLFGSKTIYSLNKISRIVYHPDYNITFCGIEKCHPFDSQKYKNIYNRLVDNKIVAEQQTVKPNLLPRSFLLQKMSKIYLLKLCYSLGVCRYIQMPLIFLPAFTLRWRVLNPMLLATEGTILSALSAKTLKWSINLSGGFHHASFDRGGGFCIYPDISLAIHYLKTRQGYNKIMIIDLDAHQGNGHERDHIKREDIYIVDAYNHQIYPRDQSAKGSISRDFKINANTTDEDYLKLISTIERDIDSFAPEFVFYNAGTDILADDPLGGLNISSEAIVKRDEIIIGMCIKNKIPVSMVLSGGYQKVNAQIIAESIENLIHKFS